MKIKFLLPFLLFPFGISGQTVADFDSLKLYHFSKGNYDSALYFTERSTAISFQKNGRQKDTLYLKNITDIGVLARYKGDFRLAEEKLSEAMQVSKNILGETTKEYATAANELAAVYLFLNNLEKAEICYRKAMEIRKRMDPAGKDYANSLNNLANIYRDQGKIRGADSLLQEALRIMIKAKGEITYEVGMFYGNIARLRLVQEIYEGTEAILFKADTIIRKTLGDSHPYRIHIGSLLSELYLFTGQPEKALVHITFALELAKVKISEWHTDYRKLLSRMAQVLAELGKTEESLQHFNELIENNRKQIERSFTFLSEREKLVFINALKQQLSIFYLFAFRQNRTKPELAGKAYDQELLLKGLLLQSGKEMQRTVESSGDSSLVALYEKLKNQKKEISRLYALPAEKRIADPVRLEEQANVTEKMLANKCERFSGPNSKLSYTWQEVRTHLKKDEAAIEYISVREPGYKVRRVRYYAMVVLPESTAPKVIPLFYERELDSVMQITDRSSASAFVKELYAASRGVKPVHQPQGGPQGKELYNLVWAPVDSLIRSKRAVYYAPTGMLHTISFAAIPTPTGQMLCERYQLNCVGSTRQVIQPASVREEKFRDIIIYGGIEYSGDSLRQASHRGTELFAQRSMIPEVMQRGGGWNYLRGTREEAESLNRILKKALKTQLLTGSQGTEDSFKAMDSTGSPDIIHISTHGFFIPEKYSGETAKEPLLRSGLIMAGANRVWLGGEVPEGCDDGILTAYEVSNLNLSKTKLVVLSACETGLGDIQGSEGVYGLQRAFKMAGVRYIIMSLWQVPDKETVEFMQTFYRHLEKGSPVRDAFTQTQRFMRKKYEPYFWAAFVLIE